MQGVLASQRGSARLGLSIAVAFLAVLAVAAVPMVSRQAASAQDTRAQDSLSRLAKEIETCRATAESYRDCDEPRELGRDEGDGWGHGAGNAGVLTGTSEERRVTAYSISANGSHTYVWASSENEVRRSSCRHASLERLEREGCDDSGW